MPRPRSIVLFEYCYLGAWLLGLVNLALTWNGRVEQAVVTAVQGGSTTMAGHAGAVILFSVGVGAAITIALWYFVACRASVVAKWIVVALFAIGLVGLAMHPTRVVGAPAISGVLSVVAYVLQIVAIAMLFRPDATAWFARGREVVR